MFAQRKILGLVTVLAVTGLLLVAASGVFAHHKSGHGGAGLRRWRYRHGGIHRRGR